jgi:molecular chaperone DnaK (HSP70)
MAADDVKQKEQKEKEKKKDEHLLGVRAFDIGTSRSGFAYALFSKPKEILTIQSTTGVIKDLTALLFDDKNRFVEFGENARQRYYELTEEEQKKWGFYKGFKMQAYGSDFKDAAMIVTAENGLCKMSYIDLLAETIKHLDTLWTEQTKTYRLLDRNNFKTCITVPAMWSEFAKSLVRKAAIKAGLIDSLVEIILESEAASICCKVNDSQHWKPDMHYAVFDLGGGTCDVTVHRVNSAGVLLETSASGGGPWGSTFVDAAWEKFLCDLFGADRMDAYKKEKPADYLEMCQTFETVKTQFSPETKVSRIPTPFSFLRHIDGHSTDNKNLLDAIARYGMRREGEAPTVSWSDGKLILSRALMMSFIDPLLENILNYFNSQVKSKNQTVSHVFFVGGFSESKYVQKLVQSKFAGVQISIPPRPSLSVLQGAVYYGLTPSVISSRIVKATYGICVSQTCQKTCTSHADHALRPANGIATPYVENIFSVFCRAGDSINYNSDVKQDYTPAEDNQDFMVIKIYQSANPKPEFVTDPGCTLVGKMTIGMSPTGGLSRKVRCSFFFGNTQIIVKAVDLTSLTECQTILKFSDNSYDGMPVSS